MPNNIKGLPLINKAHIFKDNKLTKNILIKFSFLQFDIKIFIIINFQIIKIKKIYVSNCEYNKSKK